MFIFGILALIAGIAAAGYGIMQNNSIEAQFESIMKNGSTDPGNMFIIIGVIAAVVGLIFIIVAQSKKNQ